MTRRIARTLVVAACAVSFAGCAQRPPRVDLTHLDELAQCADERASTIGISAMALPIAIPSDIVAKGPRDTRGLLARRISVTFAPGSIRPGGALLWSRLNVRSYGGTFEGWTRLHSDGLSIDLAAPATANPADVDHPPSSRPRGLAAAPSGAKPRSTESGSGSAPSQQAAVAVAPGYLIVSRVAPAGDRIASNLSVDALFLPGGMTIDEPVASIPALWATNGAPLAPDSLAIELKPVSHVPGYDLIDASVSIDYALRDRGGAVCRGSAETRVTIADRESVRPALWDIGLSSLNGQRNRWLAFRDTRNGVFRALFESPQEAASFANWIRATSSVRAGRYTLGLFERQGREPLRPLVPIDASANETFRELSPEDTKHLRTGPLGEP
jgi:hypothetical protein